MQRKFIIGVSLVALAIAIIGSGVLYAYFTDSQQTGSNQITANNLKLSVDGTVNPDTGGPNVPASFTVPAVKPGDGDPTPGGSLTPHTPLIAKGWLLKNSGNVAGDLSISVGTITPGATNILGSHLKVAIWVDKDKDGAWTANDYYLTQTGTTVSFVTGDLRIPDGAFQTLNSYVGKTINTNGQYASGIAGGAEVGKLTVSYFWPWGTAGSDNDANLVSAAQSSFPITFTLSQHYE